jgi:hypothetical protein
VYKNVGKISLVNLNMWTTVNVAYCVSYL